MVAPSVNFTAIAYTAVDVDSPVDETLMTALVDRDEHLRQWIGGSYTAHVDHNHDGINSALLSATIFGNLFAFFNYR